MTAPLICTVVAAGVVTVTVPELAGATVLMQSVAASVCPPHAGTGGAPATTASSAIVSVSVPPTLIAQVPKSISVPGAEARAAAVVIVAPMLDVTCAFAVAPANSVSATALVTASFFIVEKFMVGFSF